MAIKKHSRSKPKPNAATLRRLTKYNTNSDGDCSPALTVAQFGDMAGPKPPIEIIADMVVKTFEQLEALTLQVAMLRAGKQWQPSEAMVREETLSGIAQREEIQNQAEQIRNLTKQRDSARASLAANIQNLGDARAQLLAVTTEHDKMAGQLLTAKRMLAGFRTENTSSPFGEEG